MKINSPEDIVSAYATMRLLEPICGDGHSIILKIHYDQMAMEVLDAGFDVVATTSFAFERFLFYRELSSYPQRLIDKLNAAMAPEQSENQ